MSSFSLHTTGQNCVSAERFYVEASVYDKFVTEIATKMKQLRTGHSHKGPLLVCFERNLVCIGSTLLLRFAVPFVSFGRKRSLVAHRCRGVVVGGKACDFGAITMQVCSSFPVLAVVT